MKGAISRCSRAHQLESDWLYQPGSSWPRWKAHGDEAEEGTTRELCGTDLDVEIRISRNEEARRRLMEEKRRRDEEHAEEERRRLEAEARARREEHERLRRIAAEKEQAMRREAERRLAEERRQAEEDARRAAEARRRAEEARRAAAVEEAARSAATAAAQADALASAERTPAAAPPAAPAAVPAAPPAAAPAAAAHEPVAAPPEGAGGPDAYLAIVAARIERAERAAGREREVAAANKALKTATRFKGVGQVRKLAATRSQVDVVAGLVCEFFAGNAALMAGEAAFDYAAFAVVGELLRYVENGESDAVAFAAAEAVRRLESTVRGLDEVVECALVRACMLFGPKWPSQRDHAPAASVAAAVGLRPDDSREAHRARLHRIARFCGARWQVRHGRTGRTMLGQAWRWVARFLNRMPSRGNLPDYAVPVLTGVLETVSPAMHVQYGAQFARMLRVIHRSVLRRLPSAKGGADVRRLNLRLAEVVGLMLSLSPTASPPLPRGLPLPERDMRNAI